MTRYSPITIELQEDNSVIVQVKKLFETVVKHIPDTNIYLDENALIVESVIFERALEKLQFVKFSDMSPEAKKSIDCLGKD